MTSWKNLSSWSDIERDGHSLLSGRGPDVVIEIARKQDKTRRFRLERLERARIDLQIVRRTGQA